jgi:protein gp37
MMATKIEWTDESWNPIRGCSRVSEGCRHCYAEKQAARFCGPGQPYDGLITFHANGENGGTLWRGWNGQIMFVEEHLLDPLKWLKPRRIFVNSMSDLFHPGVTDEMLDRIFAVMALSPRHTFQVLTKRPERMQAYIESRRRSTSTSTNASLAMAMWELLRRDGKHPSSSLPEGFRWPLPNVWLGVSDEGNQHLRLDILRQTPAAVRFVSFEPLIFNPGAVDLTGIDWAICGGESGPGARPMHPDWARGLRDQCVAAGVPFFFKQWGEWKGGDQHLSAGHGIKPGSVGPERVRWLQTDGRSAPCVSSPVGFELGPNNLVTRVGKKATGHLLDGVEWHQFPSPAGNPDLEAEHGRD